MKVYRIHRKMSLEAYKNASNDYNVTVKRGVRLKDFHYAIYKRLITLLYDKVSNDKTNRSKPSRMRVKRSELSKYFDVSSQTVKNRLSRLQKANIIKIIFHGDKSPLEIVFNTDICIILDMYSETQTVTSKFLNNGQSVTYSNIFKTFTHIIDTEDTRTNINKTIIKNDLTNSFTGTYKNNLQDTTENKQETFTEIQETTHPTVNLTDEELETLEIMAKEISKNENISFEISKERILKTLKNRKQKISPEILQKDNKIEQKTNTFITDFTEKLIVDFQKTNEQIISEILHKEKYLQNKSIEERRIFVRMKYVKIFVQELYDNLFADKKQCTTKNYYNDLLDYVNENYFANCQTMKALEMRMNEYRYRMRIAKKLIERNKDFDKTYFFPLAYLQVEKCGQKYFSFVNTEKFWKNYIKWDRFNGYNAINPEIKQKLNAICRQVELEKISFDDGMQKVKNLTKDNTELVRQYNIRMSQNVL